MLWVMEAHHESAVDVLWREYALEFREFDDLTLARWMAQTLGQLQGRVWRLSHPLVGAYRLATQVGIERQVWLKRLATIPPAYPMAECCRAPFLPLFTRDVAEDGILCQHCGETLVAFDEIPAEQRKELSLWAEQYRLLHQVAHWDEAQRLRVPNYEQECEKSARGVEKLMVHIRRAVLPKFLDYYPAVVWEDSDECLDVRPEDLKLNREE